MSAASAASSDGRSASRASSWSTTARWTRSSLAWMSSQSVAISGSVAAAVRMTSSSGPVAVFTRRDCAASSRSFSAGCGLVRELAHPPALEDGSRFFLAAEAGLPDGP